MRVIWGCSRASPGRRRSARLPLFSAARMPACLSNLFSTKGPNDLFVIRVAGNGLGTEVLGSLKYAVEHLGGTLKLVVVLGHSGCGALTTAVDVFLNPGDYLALATQAFASQHSRSVTGRRSGDLEQNACGVRIRYCAQPGIPAGTDRGVDCNECSACRLLDPAGVRRQRAGENCGQPTASTSLKPAKFGHRGWAERREPGWLSRPAISLNFAAFGDAIVQSDRIASFLRTEK